MSLHTPQEVMARLQGIDDDLATRQNELENAAFEWFREKRERERAYAQAYIEAKGTVDERKSKATEASYLIGVEAEARYEALKAVTRVLETRASIGMALLKAQTRSGGA